MKTVCCSPHKRRLTTPRYSVLLLVLALAGALVCCVSAQPSPAPGGRPTGATSGGKTATGAPKGAPLARASAPSVTLPASSSSGAFPVPSTGARVGRPLSTRLPPTQGARTALARSQSVALQKETAAAKTARAAASGARSQQGWNPRTAWELHNALRARHGADPLSWDNGVADYAQNYANRCIWGHNPNLQSVGMGENLGLGHSSLAAATQAWYDEVNVYNFGNPGFSMATGHFTQLVWRATTRIGCGAAFCANLGGRVLYVCNYSPGGNVVNAGYFQSNVLPARG